MVNLKLCVIFLVIGALLFLLSDTVFGDSDMAAYSALVGLILFLIGVVLALAGTIQVLVAKVKGRMHKQ